MDFDELINEIIKLNPDIEIRIGNPNLDSQAYDRIFSSIPMEQLKLPEGYYSNTKNGITNKHNSSMYTSLKVESIEKMPPGLTLPVENNALSTYDTNVFKQFINWIRQRVSQLRDKIFGEKNITQENNSNISPEKQGEPTAQETLKSWDLRNYSQEKPDIENTTRKTLPDPKLYPQYDFSFEGLKKCYDDYTLSKDDKGNSIAIEKSTGAIYADNLIVKKVRFANLWNKSAMSKQYDTSEKTNDYCFNNGARRTYEYIMNKSQQQLESTGNINTKNILRGAKEELNPSYKYTDDIIRKLFDNESQAQLLTDYFRLATPNAKRQTQATSTIEDIYMGR